MGFFDFGFGDLLGGATSLIGGSISAKAQRDTNRTNLQIARETNQANRDNQEYQNEWNLNMWNAQNAYNSPDAQRQRLEDAGLNPIFYGLDGTGNAGALSSAPFTAVNGAPMENDGKFLGEAIMNAGNASLAFAQAKKADKEAEGVGIANEIADATKERVIQNTNLSVTVTRELLKKTRQERLKIGAEIQKISDEREELQAHAAKLKEETTYIKKYFDLENDKYKLDQSRYWNETDKQLMDQFIAFEQLMLDKRRVNLEELLDSELVQYLAAQSESVRHDTYEKLTTFFQRVRNMRLSGDKMLSDMKVNDSNVVLNYENAKLVGKKNDYYEYELVINGLKTVVLTATLLF